MAVRRNSAIAAEALMNNAGYPRMGTTTETAAEILSFLFRSANLPYNACWT